MASFADEALPSLPPIKTAPLEAHPSSPGDAASAAPSPATSTTSTQESATGEDTTKAAVTEDREEPATPTSEESRLRTPAACPPAPRKPPVPRMPAVKRKSRPTLTTTTTSRVCLAVPRDLSVVFRSMPMTPAEKRIRAS
ncbi:unnamed protein product [Alopecurus aequalis]